MTVTINIRFFYREAEQRSAFLEAAQREVKKKYNPLKGSEGRHFFSTSRQRINIPLTRQKLLKVPNSYPFH